MRLTHCKVKYYIVCFYVHLYIFWWILILHKLDMRKSVKEIFQYRDFTLAHKRD